MDASGVTDERAFLRTAKSCGPDASMVGVKLADLSAGDGDNKARSPGRVRGRPLKPLRAGMPGDPGATVVTNACVLLLYTRGRGCNGHPAFPAPLGVAPRPPFQGEKYTHHSGATRRGNADTHPIVIVRLDRTIQYSRVLVMESKGCGVLDTPLSRSMTAYYGAARRSRIEEPLSGWPRRGNAGLCEIIIPDVVM
jgi:hypothetical protein